MQFVWNSYLKLLRLWEFRFGPLNVNFENPCPKATCFTWQQLMFRSVRSRWIQPLWDGREIPQQRLVMWPKLVTRSSELKGIMSGVMAALTRCRAFFQFLRPQMSTVHGGCISQDVLQSLLHNRVQCARHAVFGATRQYSSDVKSGDDLIVKYLDGNDSGRSDTTSLQSLSIRFLQMWRVVQPKACNVSAP